MEKSKKGFITRKLVVVFFLIIYLFISFVMARGEYLEIKEIGEQYVSIFYTNVANKLAVTVLAFAISYIIIYFSNLKLKSGLEAFFVKEQKEMPKLPNKSISFIASLIVSLLAQVFLTEKFLMFMNSAKFGINDPIFKFDISFYLFKLPFIKSLIIFGIIYTVILTLYSVVYYIVTLNKYFDGVDRETLINNSFIKQVIGKVIVIALLVAGIVILSSVEIENGNMINLNDDTKTEIIGAGLTDVKIKLWGYRLFALAILISVIRVIKYVKQFKVKKIVNSMLIVPIYLVVLFIVMTGFQYFYAERNELDKQRKYLNYNIEYTRQAYNIKVDEVDVNSVNNLSLDSINLNVLKNASIITEEANLDSLAESKDSEVYYTYGTSNIGLYNIDGEKKPVYITPRELASGVNGTYSSKTYQYTHGYGVVVSDISNVDDKGNVEYIQSEYDDNVLGITEPRIYFGMATNETVVTGAKDKKEFDYPISSKSYEEYEYKGKAGINAGLLDRLVLAIHNGDHKLVTSFSVTDNSKIIMNRNIRERAKALMPYFVYDEHPYLVVTDSGKLVWVLDAYTISNSYPYSQKSKIKIEGNYKEINYIRNSVKVLVDAYDGTVSFYIIDRTDPIAMMYRNIYPDLFMDKDATIPKDIQKNIVYPEYLFDIQAQVLERYHDVNAEMLYRVGDAWTVSRKSDEEDNRVNSTYTMLKTVDSKGEELGLVTSYNKLNKQSLNSYLVGRYDNGNKLTIYKMSQDSNLPGIKQLQIQIEQDKDISEELSKINTPGTKVDYNTFIIPLENTVLYVEPFYQTMINEDSAVPALKKVIVATGDKVAIGNNLEEAILKLISDSAYDLGFINTDSEDELIEAIIKANNNLKDSSRANNWELIGNDLKELQSLIDTLEEVRKNTDNSVKSTKKKDDDSTDFRELIDTIIDSSQSKNESE
ncbi:MAG: UPF0182 family protein [Clostridia bacterium]|nr:UPF0182 family protein [Clostridia bacterium]